VAPKTASMTEREQPGPLGRRIDRQLRRKGRLRPRYAAYVIVVAWSIGVVVFGVVERLVDPGTFDNVWLGMWWAIQTVTTVGYGDVVPGSTAGKVIATFLMLGGLSLFAVVTGAITSAFVAQRQKDMMGAGADPVVGKLDEVTAKLDALQAEVARLNGGTD
jgi:voltage-gated potassium channel